MINLGTRGKPACICKKKDKINWEVIGRREDGNYIIECKQCHGIWETKEDYVDELKEAKYLKRKRGKSHGKSS